MVHKPADQSPQAPQAAPVTTQFFVEVMSLFMRSRIKPKPLNGGKFGCDLPWIFARQIEANIARGWQTGAGGEIGL